MNRRALSGPGPPSGSIAGRFEGAEGPGRVSIVLASVTAPPAGAAVEIRVGTSWFTVVSAPDVQQRTVPQDALQLLHGLSGDAHLTVGHPGQR